MSSNQVIGFLYPIARANGWGEPAYEGAHTDIEWNSNWVKGDEAITVITTNGGVIIEVARKNTKTGDFAICADKAILWKTVVGWFKEGR